MAYPNSQFGAELARLGDVYARLYVQFDNLQMNRPAASPAELLLMVDELTPIAARLKMAVAQLAPPMSKPATGLDTITVPNSPPYPRPSSPRRTSLPLVRNAPVSALVGTDTSLTGSPLPGSTLTGAGTPVPTNPSAFWRNETGATRGGSKGGSGGSGDLGGDDSMRHGVGGNGVGGIYQSAGYGQPANSNGWGYAQGSPLMLPEATVAAAASTRSYPLPLLDLMTPLPLPPTG